MGVTITIKHNIQESQEASPVPASDHKAAMNRKEREVLFFLPQLIRKALLDMSELY